MRRRAESPDAPALMTRLGDMAPTLWERRPTNSDFLCLRLGVADLPAESKITIQDGGDPEIRSEAEAKLAASNTVPSVPMALDLRRAGVVGLAGERSIATGLARWLMLQASILHSPGELVVMAALTPETYREWSWLKWLPHLRPDRVGLQTAAIAVGRTEAENLLAEIRELARQRRGQARAQAVSGVRPPQLLLLIDEDTGVDRALVSSALTDVADLGITALWLGRDARNLPGQTGAIVEIDSARAVLSLTDVASGQTTGEVSAEAVTLELAERTARLLAPVRDIGELARAGDIPKRVGLLDLLGPAPTHRRGPRTEVGRLARRSACDRRSRRRRGAEHRSAQRRAARADRRHDRVGQERAAAHPRRGGGRGDPARSTLVPARRLQGRGGVRTVRGPSARGRHRERSRMSTWPSGLWSR